MRALELVKVQEKPRMAKVLVAGGLFDDEIGEARVRFAAALGRCLIERGHVVLDGCRTSLDAIVAEAAATAAKERKLDPRRVVRSWVTATTKPSHRCGELMRSQLDDWSRVPRGLVYPETVQEADVVLVVGGWNGTHFAASWARLAAKPLLPVATFGFAAAEIYKDEVLAFERRYGMRLTLNDYQASTGYCQISSRTPSPSSRARWSCSPKAALPLLKLSS
jgi:hypothetical protein